MKFVKTSSFLKVSGKMACRFEFSVFFYVFQHRSKLFFDIFSKMSFFDIRIVKNCMFLMFWRLGTMLERFFKAKSFGLHISKPKKIPGNIFFDISKVRKSSRRGLLGRQNCILSQKSVPQGAFGRIQLHFEPEKHPAGAFGGKYLISCESKVVWFFWKKKQSALNHVLIG